MPVRFGLTPLHIMKNDKIVIVMSDDWTGLYVDGKLVYENHSIEVHDLIREGLFSASIYDITSEELENHGYQCPDNLKDLKLRR